MSRFIEGEDRAQQTLFPGCLDDHVGDDNPARVVDAYVDQLDLRDFDRACPADTGRPGYHPATLLKIYLYGYLNRIQSSRRLEREAQRNVELMWLTARLAPDFKTIADFRRDNGPGIRAACAQFIFDLPAARALRACCCCYRRQQVQRRERARAQFYQRQAQAPC